MPRRRGEKSCENCKFWSQVGKSHGSCAKVPAYESGDDQSDLVHISIYPVIQDSGIVNAELITRRDFSCKRFTRNRVD